MHGQTSERLYSNGPMKYIKWNYFLYNGIFNRKAWTGMKKENVIDYKALGRRIREERLKKGMSQQELASLVQIEASNLSNIERGTGHASLNTFVKIITALDTTSGQLLQDLLPREKPENCIVLKGATEDEAALYRAVARAVKTYLKKKKRAGQKSVETKDVQDGSPQ